MWGGASAFFDLFDQAYKEEIDAMWKNGKMTQAKFDSFENLHERTPYKH